jgi:hypothetical protein
MSPNTSPESPEKRNSLRHFVTVLALLAAAYIAGALILAGTHDVLANNPAWLEIAHDHFAAIVGLPAAAFTSFFVVLILEVKTGRVEFEVWRMKFKGASGEVVMFVLVFLAIAVALKMLW